MKIKKDMVIHCFTKEEFYRIGKMINELYPKDEALCEDYDFGFDHYGTSFCFSTLNESQWEYSPYSYYEGKGYEITESTEIE